MPEEEAMGVIVLEKMQYGLSTQKSKGGSKGPILKIGIFGFENWWLRVGAVSKNLHTIKQ